MGFGITVLVIVLGCSTANKVNLPPSTELMPPEMASWPINNQLIGNKDFISIDLFLNRVAKENPGTTVTWWVDYRRAQLWSKKDKNVACENFSRLAGEIQFPIRRLAYLHAHEVCPKNNQILARLENFNVDQFEPWLSDTAVDVAIKKAKATNDHAALVDLNLRKSKMNLRKEEKVAYADEALKYAQKLQNKEKIRELKNRIYNLSPSRNEKPTSKEYLAMAYDYRYRRKFVEAVTFFNKVVKTKSLGIPDKIQALRGIRTTYKIQQQKEEAVKATENLAKFVEKIYKKSQKNTYDAKLFADTYLFLAKTYWTENEHKKAIHALDRIQRTVQNKTSLAEVFLTRGRMEEEKQNFSDAIMWHKKALDENINSDSFRNKISWYLAWNEYKQKNYPEAVRLLKNLKNRTENNFERSRIIFWLAKSLREKNDNAEDEFKQLIKEDPLSYYGLAAHREMDIPLPSKSLYREDSVNKAAVQKLTLHLREVLSENYLEWLIATKEIDVAKNYLDSVANEVRKKFKGDVESWVSLFNLYGRSQNYPALFAQLGQLDSSVRRTIIDENPYIIFPNPYYETVSQAASRFGVSVEFIYSIMRQESSFNPQARSQMDAFGLMQLLPEVARRSANANSIEFTNTEDLYEPHINIPLGSAHLRELWDKYNGEIILAVASYNASEKAILSWLKTRYRGDTLEFIEDIPYDETRDYVKLVLRNLIAYEILNSQESTILFPEWTLKISHQNTDIKLTH
ncbi:MAG: hypothetical protein A2Z20_05025 [Bdellovibrionales bacterium RBG_16_40_8]|nr:MAG: hypothetical protein A2Z20_05025 [Bdellovibrionales bacterium RBG_16_40_8]